MGMVLQQQLHTVDTLWELVCAPENDDKRFHLIDGELFAFPRARYALPGRLIASLMGYIYDHVERKDLGMTLLGVGHYSADDNHTVLGPAISFLGKARTPRPLRKNGSQSCLTWRWRLPRQARPWGICAKRQSLTCAEARA